MALNLTGLEEGGGGSGFGGCAPFGCGGFGFLGGDIQANRAFDLANDPFSVRNRLLAAEEKRSELTAFQQDIALARSDMTAGQQLLAGAAAGGSAPAAGDKLAQFLSSENGKKLLIAAGVLLLLSILAGR